MTEPARRVLPHTSRTTRHTSPWSSGNWARSSLQPERAFLFLSEQEPTQFLAQGRSGGRGFASFPLASAGAAHIGARRTAAKSLPPFFEVKHVCHGQSSYVQSRKQERRSEAFHEAGKSFHERNC